MQSDEAVLRDQFVNGGKVWVVSVLVNERSLANSVFLIDLLNGFIDTNVSRCACLHDCSV